MYEQITEQLQSSLKPFAALMEINIKAVESLAEQQSSFFSSTLNDTLAFSQDISSQTDLASVLKVQKEYGEDFQDKLITASKDIYSLLVESQTRKNEIYKTVFTQGQELAATMTAPAKPAGKSTTKRKSAAN